MYQFSNFGNFSPVTSMTVNDMLNCQIQYVYDRAQGYAPQRETGKVIAIKQVRNILYMEIQPDNPCLMTKWRSEFDFVSYVRVNEKAIA